MDKGNGIKFFRTLEKNIRKIILDLLAAKDSISLEGVVSIATSSQVSKIHSILKLLVPTIMSMPNSSDVGVYLASLDYVIDEFGTWVMDTNGIIENAYSTITNAVNVRNARDLKAVIALGLASVVPAIFDAASQLDTLTKQIEKVFPLIDQPNRFDKNIVTYLNETAEAEKYAEALNRVLLPCRVETGSKMIRVQPGDVDMPYAGTAVAGYAGNFFHCGAAAGADFVAPIQGFNDRMVRATGNVGAGVIASANLATFDVTGMAGSSITIRIEAAGLTDTVSAGVRAAAVVNPVHCMHFGFYTAAPVLIGANTFIDVIADGTISLIVPAGAVTLNTHFVTAAGAAYTAAATNVESFTLIVMDLETDGSTEAPFDTAVFGTRHNANPTVSDLIGNMYNPYAITPFLGTDVEEAFAKASNYSQWLVTGTGTNPIVRSLNISAVALGIAGWPNTSVVLSLSWWLSPDAAITVAQKRMMWDQFVQLTRTMLFTRAASVRYFKDLEG
jgi:hypothetical protein